MGLTMLFFALLFIVTKQLFWKKNNSNNKKLFIIFVAIILILFFGSRDAQIENGSDLNNYYRFYERALIYDRSTFFEMSTFEPGYIWLNWCLSRVIKWPQFIVYFQAAFCLGLTLRFIYKYSDDVVMSLLGFMSLGLMQFYLTGFRQSIAISICLIALEFALNNKLIPFIIAVFLAMQIHQTSIVFFVVYILVRMPVKKITVFVDFVIIIIISLSIPKLMEFGNDVFEKHYLAKYEGTALGGIINISIAMFIIVIMCVNLQAHSNVNNYEKENIELRIQSKADINYKLIHILIIGTGIYAMRFQAQVFERISLYFTPVMFILLPQVINSVFIGKNAIIMKAVFGFGMLLLIYVRMTV